jgi:hypothetical protein
MTSAAHRPGHHALNAEYADHVRHTRRHRRAFRRLVGAAVLGLITTVATAWACELLVNVEPTREEHASSIVRIDDPTFKGRLFVRSSRRFGSAYYAAGVWGSKYKPPWVGDFNGTDWDRDAGEPDLNKLNAIVESSARPIALPWLFGRVPWPAEDSTASRTTNARGWPFLCLWNEYLLDLDRTPLRFTTRGCIPLDRWMAPRQLAVYLEIPVVLPFLPIWRGLLFNTLVFASFWWLILFVPGTLRRHIRCRRHRCPTCGYDLKNLPPAQPCPECGQARTDR